LIKIKTRRVDKKRNLRKLKKLIKEGGEQRKKCIFVSEIHTIRKTLLAKTQKHSSENKEILMEFGVRPLGQQERRLQKLVRLLGQQERALSNSVRLLG
jgi:hypothetical protein